MASPSVQMRVKGGGEEGGREPTRGILRSRRALLRKSGYHHRKNEPSTVGSIPSRYQVFYRSSSEAKGFNSQSTRFHHHSIDETPGPGTYTTPQSCLTLQSTASDSIAGSGGFASKSKRFRRGGGGNSIGPGPATYNPSLQPLRYDFNSAPVSRFFQAPIAVTPEERRTKPPSPSPTTYHPSHAHTQHNRVVSVRAAFKSRTVRGGVPISTSSSSALTPSPSHYHINDSLLHPTTSSHSSSFISKSSRQGLPLPTSGPGPADYFPHPSSTKPSLNSTTTSSLSPPSPPPSHASLRPTKRYFRISAPAIALPPLPPSPGPGHYETQGSILKSKTVRPSGCYGFISNVGRWGSKDNGNHANDKPGPGSYDPVGLPKRSYLYNVNRKWI